MGDVGWRDQYVNGDAESICMDGWFTLVELKQIVSTLEDGNFIYWAPRKTRSNSHLTIINNGKAIAHKEK